MEWNSFRQAGRIPVPSRATKPHPITMLCAEIALPLTHRLTTSLTYIIQPPSEPMRSLELSNPPFPRNVAQHGNKHSVLPFPPPLRRRHRLCTKHPSRSTPVVSTRLVASSHSGHTLRRCIRAASQSFHTRYRGVGAGRASHTGCADLRITHRSNFVGRT